MNLTDIALQNLRRRKGRTIFLLLTFLLVNLIIISLQVFANDLKDDLQRSLTQYGANVIITPRSEHLALSYGGLAVPGLSYEIKALDSNVLNVIHQVTGTGIQEIAPKVIGKINSGNKSFLVVGVDFASELKIKPWWKIIGHQPSAGEIVAGATVARDNNLTTGGRLNFDGKSYIVAGIMNETGGSEDNVVFTDIPTARALTGNIDSWSIIEINTLQPEPTVASLSNLLPTAKVEDVSQLVQGTQESVDRFRNYSRFSSIILILIGILILGITITANVNNRTQEIGIFQAIGFRKRHILGLLWREIFILCLGGSLAGYVLGTTIPLFLGPLIFAKNFIYHPYPGLGLITIGASLILTSISLVYPAWKSSQLDPAQALNSI